MNIIRHDLPYPRFGCKPIQRRIGKVHFTFAIFRVMLHPPYDISQVVGFKRIDNNASELNPSEQLEALRNAEQVACLR